MNGANQKITYDSLLIFHYIGLLEPLAFTNKTPIISVISMPKFQWYRAFSLPGQFAKMRPLSVT